jgi:hypothetical protein
MHRYVISIEPRGVQPCVQLRAYLSPVEHPHSRRQRIFHTHTRLLRMPLMPLNTRNAGSAPIKPGRTADLAIVFACLRECPMSPAPTGTQIVRGRQAAVRKVRPVHGPEVCSQSPSAGGLNGLSDVPTWQSAAAEKSHIVGVLIEMR